MTDYRNSPEFKELQKKWRQKLAKAGFKDIENDHPENPYLINWTSHYFFQNYTPQAFEERARYFEKATHFYWHYLHFKSSLEKKIWRLHCEGHSRRKIANELNKKDYRMSHNNVQKIVTKLKIVMHSNDWASSEGQRDFSQKSDEWEWLERNWNDR